MGGLPSVVSALVQGGLVLGAAQAALGRVYTMGVGCSS